MRDKTIFIIALAAALFMGGQALAAGSGFYLGAGIGQTNFERDLSNSEDFDESDTSYRVFGGYRLGILPLLDLAGEVGYRDAGNPSQDIGGESFDVEMSGADLTALVILPVGPIDLYIKGGGLWYDLDKSFAGLDKSDEYFGALYGAGIGARIWKLGVRAEYEIADIEGIDDSSMYWLGIYYTF